MKEKQLRKGIRVLVKFNSDYYRGDGSEDYGTYVGYDRKSGKYMINMYNKVAIPHNQVKIDKNTSRPYLSETHRTYENAIAYVNRENIFIIGVK